MASNYQNHVGGGGGDIDHQSRGIIAYDHTDRNFERRWANRRIPRPPKTPCEDPLEMPFQNLRSKSLKGKTTLDEELLIAVVKQFADTPVLPFSTIFDNLKKNGENDFLMFNVFNDADYVWAYLRCYPEHFEMDRDPCHPDYVWYLNKCKVVPKTDRARYERAFTEGKFKISTNTPTEDNLDQVQYDDGLEQASLTNLVAIFTQLASKLIANGKVDEVNVPMRFIRMVLKSGQIPKHICEYIGENLDEFINYRRHIFTAFGSQVHLRSTSYVVTVRSLTEQLQRLGGVTDFGRFYQFLKSSLYLRINGVRAICKDKDPNNFQYNDFLMFLHGLKFLFRLRARDGLIELRHGVVPDWNEESISSVPIYEAVRTVQSTKELVDFDFYTGQENFVNTATMNGPLSRNFAANRNVSGKARTGPEASLGTTVRSNVPGGRYVVQYLQGKGRGHYALNPLSANPLNVTSPIRRTCGHRPSTSSVSDDSDDD